MPSGQGKMDESAEPFLVYVRIFRTPGDLHALKITCMVRRTDTIGDVVSAVRALPEYEMVVRNLQPSSIAKDEHARLTSHRGIDHETKGGLDDARTLASYDVKVSRRLFYTVPASHNHQSVSTEYTPPSATLSGA